MSFKDSAPTYIFGYGGSSKISKGNIVLIVASILLLIIGIVAMGYDSKIQYGIIIGGSVLLLLLAVISQIRYNSLVQPYLNKQNVDVNEKERLRKRALTFFPFFKVITIINLILSLSLGILLLTTPAMLSLKIIGSIAISLILLLNLLFLYGQMVLLNILEGKVASQEKRGSKVDYSYSTKSYGPNDYEQAIEKFKANPQGISQEVLFILAYGFLDNDDSVKSVVSDLIEIREGPKLTGYKLKFESMNGSPVQDKKLNDYVTRISRLNKSIPKKDATPAKSYTPQSADSDVRRN